MTNQSSFKIQMENLGITYDKPRTGKNYELIFNMITTTNINYDQKLKLYIPPVFSLSSKSTKCTF